jgi:cleavage and polyadenylation specificity factor subunit 2
MNSQLWSSEDAGLGLYPLIMMSNQAQNVVEFAKSQVEWMSEKVMRSFEEYRTNPFELR